MFRKKKISLQEQALHAERDAANASRIYDHHFSEYLAGRCSIHDLKPFVELSQCQDKKMLAIQARLREKRLQQIESLESVENQQIEVRRQTMIKVLTGIRQ